MEKILNRTRLIMIFGAAVPLFGAAVARIVQRYYGREDLDVIAALLAVYFVVFVTQPLLSTRFPFYTNIFLTIQTTITVVLLMYPREPFDFFSILAIPACISAVFYLPRPAAFRWIGLTMLLLSVALLLRFDWLEGIGYILAYVAVLFFLGAISVMTLRAVDAQYKSQVLLEQLQEAHRKLQVYASQAEELAAAHERNHLARELHDSVTQTIFSMTLTAQAARILLDRDPSRVAGQLEHLQDLSKSALIQMRGLIQQLRPKSVAEEGLVTALRRHAVERKSQDGLAVDLQVEGDHRLPAEMEETLFRIVQEALNNVVKHAGCGEALVRLRIDGSPASLLVEDNGVGFDPQAAGTSPAHIGLSSMEERARSLGGSLSIESEPGKGTRIRVENLHFQEA